MAQNETVYCDSASYPPREVLDYIYRRGNLPDASDVEDYCGFLRWRCWGDRS